MNAKDSELTREQRLSLINLVCAFAWTDFELDSRERAHVRELCRRFELDADARAQVDGWLESPPDPEELADPGAIPLIHREAFLQECQRVILVDAYVDPEESMAYRVFREILMSERRQDG